MEFLDADGSWENLVSRDDSLDLTSAWRPPTNLTLEKVGALASIVSLADAINVMAFGGQPPESEAASHGRPNLDNVRRRIQAARALFKAGLDGVVRFYGSQEVGGDATELIKEDYFRVPRALGRQDNTIEIDQLSVSFDVLEAFWRGKRDERWNVSVDRTSFVEWCKKELAAGADNLREAGKLIEKGVKDDPNLTQEGARQLVKEGGVNISRKKIRDLLKQAGGSQKPGPRGPRKNRAAPSA